MRLDPRQICPSMSSMSLSDFACFAVQLFSANLPSSLDMQSSPTTLPAHASDRVTDRTERDDRHRNIQEEELRRRASVVMFVSDPAFSRGGHTC